jgi:Tfp pilus assembly protein PilO
MAFSTSSIIRFFQRHLVVIGIVTGIVLFVIGLIVIIIPQYQNVQKLGGLNYNQKQAQLEVVKQNLENLRQLRDGLNQVSPEDLERIYLIIPKGKDIPGIFNQMQQFANEAKMTLLSVAINEGAAIAPVTPTSTTGTLSKVKQLSVSVILGGALNYEATKNFLNVVSRQAPILDLTSISYTPNSAATASSYKFSFRSYYIEP